MKFKDTEYGDLSGTVFDGNMSVSKKNISSLEGAPKEVKGYFDCTGNPNLNSLQYAPKQIKGQFAIYDVGIKDIKSEIIKNQIYANNYYTKGIDGKWDLFDLKDIEKDLNQHKDTLMKNNIKRKGFRTLLGIDK